MIAEVPSDRVGRSRRSSLHRIAITFVVFSGFFWAFFHRMGLTVIAPDMESAFGLSAAALGLLGAVYFFPYSLMQIPIGVAVDALGARSTLTGLLGLAGVGSLLFALASDFQQAVVGRFLVGFGVAVVYLAAQRLFVDWYHPRRFATITAFMNSFGNLGGISASLPLAVASAAFGWRQVFVLVSVFILVTAFLSFAVVRNRPAAVEKANKMEKRGTPWVAVGESLKVMASGGQLWLLAAAVLPYVGTRFGFQSLWGGPYLSSVYRLSTEEIGTLMMVMSISAMVASPVIGYLSDRVFESRKRFAMAGFVGYAATWIPLVFFTASIPLPAMYLLMAAMGALTVFWVPVYAQAKESYSLVVAGSVLAVVNFAATFGGAVYQQAMGVVIALFEKGPSGYPAEAYSAAFALCLGTVLLGTILLALSKEKPRGY